MEGTKGAEVELTNAFCFKVGEFLPAEFAGGKVTFQGRNAVEGLQLGATLEEAGKFLRSGYRKNPDPNASSYVSDETRPDLMA